MAGGNWTAQNKVRPGIYFNFKSRTTPKAAQGARGTVAIPRGHRARIPRRSEDR